jgi:signal recognition particle GTPase
MTHQDPTQIVIEDRLIIIVGNFGSGKTEVAVNLAFYCRDQGSAVTIADLDVVNPYFRCREQKEAMEDVGIRVIVPEGDKRWADLPIILPEIKGMAEADDDACIRIFDVGGDDVGATVLSSLREAIADRPYSLWQVVNTKRPFTDSVVGILAMKNAIEKKSRMSVNGFIANSHLMGDTTAGVILEGIEIAKKTAEKGGINTVFAAVMSNWKEEPSIRTIDVPVLFMERRMLPPWKAEMKSPPRGFRPSVGRCED